MKNTNDNVIVLAPTFPLGTVVMTIGVSENVPMAAVQDALSRHGSRDWGDLCDEDREQNDLAVSGGGRLLSSYETSAGKLWVITEWDRSVTTVLFPEEY